MVFNKQINTINKAIEAYLTLNDYGYQWRLFHDTICEELINSGIHSGITTPALNITNVAPFDNGNQYHMCIINSLYICSDSISDSSVLMVCRTMVIMTRRFT